MVKFCYTVLMNKCSIENCNDEVHAKSYCKFHYTAWSRHGDPLYVRDYVYVHDKPCTVNDCETKQYCAGYCHRHYGSLQRYKDPLYVDRPETKRVCTVGGCERPYYSVGYCVMHGSRFRRYGDPLFTKKIKYDHCTADNCSKKTVAKGLCSTHYSQMRLNGIKSSLMTLVHDIPKDKMDKRFWSKVNRNGPAHVQVPELGNCWLWIGSKHDTGYADIFISYKRMPVHRLAYMLLVGGIPEGKDLDHLCHTYDTNCNQGNRCLHRSCVNPSHLEPTSKQENTLRGRSPIALNAKKTHCLRGHSLEGDNLRTSANGQRHCKACAKMLQKQKLADKRSKI